LPYIPKDDRTRVASNGATNPGELNYELTLAIRGHLRALAPLKYEQVNGVVSALEWVKATANVPLKWPDDPLREALHRICVRYIAYKSDPHMATSTYGFHRVTAERDAVGAIECCKLEFYRRVAVPYEERKIKTNGDVY
jgi:hypothetical protein